MTEKMALPVIRNVMTLMSRHCDARVACLRCGMCTNVKCTAFYYVGKELEAPRSSWYLRNRKRNLDSKTPQRFSIFSILSSNNRKTFHEMECCAIRGAIEKRDDMMLLRAIKSGDMIWDFVFDNGVWHVIR